MEERNKTGEADGGNTKAERYWPQEAQNAQERAEMPSLGLLREDELLELDHWGPEIYQHAMFKPSGSQVTQHLSDVLIRQRTDSFQFKNQFLFHQQISEEVAEHASVLIIDRQRMLLLDVETALPQSPGQRVLIDFLTVTMPEEPVGAEGAFPHCGADLANLDFVHTRLF